MSLKMLALARLCQVTASCADLLTVAAAFNEQYFILPLHMMYVLCHYTMRPAVWVMALTFRVIDYVLRLLLVAVLSALIWGLGTLVNLEKPNAC